MAEDLKSERDQDCGDIIPESGGFLPGLELNDLGYMQISDEISQESNISYFVIQPVSIFRTYSVNLEQFNAWNLMAVIWDQAHICRSMPTL